MSLWLLTLWCALGAGAGTAQQPAGTESAKPGETAPAAPRQRTELNLLGRTDAASGESRRNENVQFDLIDNNALKELNARMGTTATFVSEFQADRSYFGAEYGNLPAATLHLGPSGTRDLHGSFHWGHNNSVFNARSFFQAGDVRPARENNYGFTAGGPLWRGATFTGEGGQQKIRGNVNGNVLVPKADERTPLTNDPALRVLVERFMAAYPAEPPNRTDINERALNTNSLQAVDDNTLGGRLEQRAGDRDRFALRYLFTTQRVDAFQLVAGQNPDTTTRAHTAVATWSRQWTVETLTDFSIGFDRIGSLLAPEEHAVGPSVSFGDVIAPLGPSSGIPIDRAQNRFRYAGAVRQTRGRHSWSLGFELGRRQVNGTEVSSHRGTIHFRNDFGRDALTNFRMGIATRFSGAFGNVHRGFRNWQMQYYAGDNWKVNGNLTLNFGVRFEPVTRPVEVNGLNTIPYGCDCNNFAPRFGFAHRLPGRWGLVRGAYGLHYGEIYAVTYQQLRYNPPTNAKFEIVVPDLRIPIKTLLGTGADPGARSAIFDISPELASPYSHQYNFTWEPFASTRWALRVGYTGSRTHKLFYLWYTNRARQVDGIPQTTATVNLRRPDPSHFDIRRILNASRGYFDAAKVTLVVPRWHGVSMDASYWLSKAIDLGAGYTNTGTGEDGRQGQSQSEFLIHRDMKGPSAFDQSHSFLLRAAYATPAAPEGWGWVRGALGKWELSAVVLAKTGTPFNVISGSDAPGYGNVDGDNGDRPHLADPSVLGRSVGNPDISRALLPRSAFAFIQPTEARGNLGANTFRKGGIGNVNGSLSRTWSVGGDRKLTFRAESINFFNTPQFAEPGRELVNPNFGSITNTLNDGRAFRFLLQFTY